MVQAPLSVRAESQKDASLAVRFLVITTPLPMEHQHFMIIVNLLGVPLFRQLIFEYRVGGTYGKLFRNEPCTYCNPVMMTVHR